MRLRRLRIEHFRRFVEPVEIADLGDGLNVIAGDNEAGKSTLLEALRTGLFEKHGLGGQAAASLMPHGMKVAPSVTIEFDTDTGRWTLEKRFCQRASARLEGPAGRFDGDAAEDELQSLLDFARPGRGPSSPVHHGVFGLLWVTQGEAFAPVSAGDRARERLSDALEQEVGDVLGGGIGRTLLERFRAESDRFWSARGGSAKGALKAARDRVAQMSEALDQARTRLGEYEGEIDELARTVESLNRLDREGGEARQRERISAAEEDMATLEARRRALEDARAALRLAEVRRDGLAEQWRQRQNLIREREAGVSRSEAAEQALTQATERATALETTLVDARRELDAAREARTQAAAAADRAARQRRHAEGRERLERLDATLSAARAADERRREAEQRLRESTLDEDGMRRLRRLGEAAGEARARQQAGATELALDVSVAHHGEGAIERNDGGYRVLGKATVHLDGVGAIGIRPGGTDVDRMERERSEAEATLARALTGVGVRDLAEAERALERRRQVEQNRASAAAELGALAPEGLAALVEAQERLQGEVQRLARDLGDSPGVPANPEEAEAALAQARDRATGAEDRHEALARELAGAREARAGRQARAEAERETLANMERQLADARNASGDDALYAALAAAKAEAEATASRVAEAEAAVAELNPEAIELTLKTAREALEQVETERRTLQQRRATLEVQLDTLGRDGLAEAVATLERDLAVAQRDLAALEREAGAVRLASEALESAAAEARAAFLGPLTERAAPYLRLLLPEASLELDDAFTPTGLDRDGTVERFEQLSLGTREQLATITRLAFADLLADQGTEVPVVLDDALVYADEGRLDRMKLVLARAAERHQVIALTCRPGDYRDLGAPMRRLDARRNA